MAISKININGTEHELETTIANVEGLQTALNDKSDVSHDHDGVYDTKGSAEVALANAKTYTDNVQEQINSVTDSVSKSILLGSGGTITLPSNSYTDMVYGDGTFVLIASGTSTTLYSADGLAWSTASAGFGTTWQSVSYGDGKFIKISPDTTTAFYSTNGGASWLTTTLPTGAWYHIDYCNDKFIMTNNDYDDDIAYSTDGINWTVSGLPSSGEWSNAVYGNGKYVIMRADDMNIVYHSDDGINWSSTSLPVSSTWYSAIYGGGKFVSVGRYSNNVVYSEDGISWYKSTLPATANWTFLTYGNGRFITVAQQSNIGAYSDDGITWHSFTLPSTANWFTLSYGAGKFILTGGGTACYYSTDGIDWSTGFKNTNNENITTIVKERVLGTGGILPVDNGGTGCSTLFDTNYTTARYRASSLHSSETTPSNNGIICWTYE